MSSHQSLWVSVSNCYILCKCSLLYFLVQGKKYMVELCEEVLVLVWD